MEQFGIFNEMTVTEIKQVCECFEAKVHDYDEGEIVVGEGEALNQFGVVLDGQAHSFKTDISGKVFTVSIIDRGGYIGAFLAGVPDRLSPVTVTATDRLTVLFMPFNQIVEQCSKGCPAHIKVTANFIAGVSEKAMHLFERIDCLLKSTTREKIMAYLAQAQQMSGGHSSFDIPFDRAGLAEYLNAERSSLSRELSKMRKEGLIDFYKNSFKILQN